MGKNLVNMIRVDKETVSVKDYLEMREKKPESIKKSRIIAPKIGSRDFGMVEVTYISPKYVAEGNM